MADLGLSPTFSDDTAQHAYDVHLAVPRWDGAVVDQQMVYGDQVGTSLHFKSHGLLNELDVGRLEADGHIAGADPTATYYSFDNYSDAVTFDYNEAMKGAVSVYNDMIAEVDPGSTKMHTLEIEGVHDINNLHWEFTDHALASAIASMEDLRDRNQGSDTSDMDALIDQATEARGALATAGANAVEAAKIFFTEIKPPGPGIETNPVDLSPYELEDGAAVDSLVVAPKA